MKNFRILSPSEQVAEYLRHQLQSGVWTDWLPGQAKLAAELSAGRDTIAVAVQSLEKEGWLVPGGRGRRRRIVRPDGKRRAGNFRVMILLYETKDRGDIDISSLLFELQDAGFDVQFAAKSLKDLGADVERVARFVEKNPADAWITCSCSRAVNEWFSTQPFPAMAMYGRCGGLPIAAAHPEMIPGLLAAVRRLIGYGHKRIVMMAREERRKPVPSRPEQLFINELEAAGIKTGDYNLPDWEENCHGLNRRLDELFRLSPPTALIFQETPIFMAARTHLAGRGIVAPRDVSLVASDPDPSFVWCEPSISHIRWDYRLVVRRVVRWAENVRSGVDDRRKRGSKTEFVEGGTIGPVPKRR